ncbi:MAG: hypothetical protein VKP62_09665 [Candidatus Sericytochromatia bacterium]|nr:hypothetical protein [Candidatus Sericytochromatia bacterium]
MALLSDDLAARFETLFQAFLGFAYHNRGGLATLALYHPRAMLSWGGKVVPACEMDADSYGLALAQQADDRELAGEGRFAPIFEQVRLAGGVQDGEERAVTWFDAQEITSGRSLAIGVGFESHEGLWGLAWLTLADHPQTWNFEAGRAQAIADYPYALSRGLGAPRTWLDLSWHRLYGHPTPALMALPEAQFSCHGSGTCCDILFGVEVEAGGQALIDAIPWEHVHPPLKGTLLPVREDGRLQLKPVGETCRFLDENRHCRIHAYLGRAAFPVCSQYPVRWTFTPEGAAITASMICGSARTRLGPPLASRVDDIHGRMALFPEALSPPFRLEEGGKDDWDAYREAEAFVLEVLARRDLKIERRLWLACLYLSALDVGKQADWSELESVADPTHPVALSTRLGVVELIASLMMDLREGPLELAPDDPETEDVLTYLCRSIVFSKQFLERYSLRMALNVAAFTVVLVRLIRRRYPEAAWSDASILVQAIGKISHGPLLNVLKHASELESMLVARDFTAWCIGGEEPQPAETASAEGEAGRL